MFLRLLTRVYWLLPGRLPRVICTQVRGPYVSTSIRSPTFVLLISLNPDGLASAGNAPRIFLKTSKKGLPYASLILCSSFALLSYMGINAGSGKVFGWLANMTSVAGLMTWFGICVTYIRFYKGMKAQGYDRSKLPFASKLNPYAAWYAMGFCLLICFVSPRTELFCWPFLIFCFLINSSVGGKYSSKGNGTPLLSWQTTYRWACFLFYTLVPNCGGEAPSSNPTKWTLWPTSLRLKLTRESPMNDLLTTNISMIID